MMDDELEEIEQEIEQTKQEIEYLEEHLDELEEERDRLIGKLPPAARPNILPETVRNWWVASGSTTAVPVHPVHGWVVVPGSTADAASIERHGSTINPQGG